MTDTNTEQLEALRLANIAEEYSAAATELRSLYAKNTALKSEIESLKTRVQELGEMLRENRSKKVIELEKRIAEAEEQMAAIGAGGVEPLRKPVAVAAPVHQPLTDEALDAMRQADNGQLNFVTLREFRIIARAVERAHGIHYDTP